jgi:non-haem dioxygenase in morphine synthesis N-terminal
VAIAEAGVHLFKQYAVGDYDAAERMIPVIRLRALPRRRAGRPRECCVRCVHVCENFGFFYALNHGVSDDTIERAFAALRRFRALPLAPHFANGAHANLRFLHYPAAGCP